MSLFAFTSFPSKHGWATPAQMLQVNGHAQAAPDLRASQDFPSLGSAPAAPAVPSNVIPARAVNAWSNGGGAAIRNNLQSSQAFVSLGALLSCVGISASKIYVSKYTIPDPGLADSQTKHDETIDT